MWLLAARWLSYVPAHTRTHAHTHTHTHTHATAHTHTHTCTHTEAHTNPHTHITHTAAYANPRTHTPRSHSVTRTHAPHKPWSCAVQEVRAVCPATRVGVLADAFAAADTDGDGRLSYSEFEAAVTVSRA